jgi:hypothetical protein
VILLTLRVCDLKPVELMTIVASGGTDKVNFPYPSAAVPDVVFAITTLAPGIGTPLKSVIVPVIVLFCA